MEFDRTAFAAGAAGRAAADDGTARGDQRDPLPAAHGLSVAHVAEGFSAALDGAAVLLRLAGQYDMAADQSSSADGGAQGRETRGQPASNQTPLTARRTTIIILPFRGYNLDRQSSE